jgi:hypothetical protein
MESFLDCVKQFCCRSKPRTFTKNLKSQPAQLLGKRVRKTELCDELIWGFQSEPGTKASKGLNSLLSVQARTTLFDGFSTGSSMLFYKPALKKIETKPITVKAIEKSEKSEEDVANALFEEL